MQSIRRYMDILSEEEPGIRPDSPTGQFLAQVNAMRVDPEWEAIMGVGRDYEFDSIDATFNLRPLDHHRIVLQSVSAGTGRQGEGSEAMRLLCSIADRCRVILLLDASPYSTRAVDVPMPREPLIAWYQRFGFVRTQHSEMERVPH